MSTQMISFPRLIIIDGLNECNVIQAQVAILNTISHSFCKHDLPMMFLVVSQPELTIVTLFNRKPLKSTHRRLFLDYSADKEYIRPSTNTLYFFFFFYLTTCSERRGSLFSQKTGASQYWWHSLIWNCARRLKA
jgi:hypothetical protein